MKTNTGLYIMELRFIYSFYKNTITNSKPIMSFYPLTKLQALSSTLELFDTNDLDQNEFNLTK